MNRRGVEIDIFAFGFSFLMLLLLIALNLHSPTPSLLLTPPHNRFITLDICHSLHHPSPKSDTTFVHRKRTSEWAGSASSTLYLRLLCSSLLSRLGQQHRQFHHVYTSQGAFSTTLPTLQWHTTLIRRRRRDLTW
ncbi:hypothetical protein XPA_008367 [Xanthoria parietina]